MYRIDRNYIFCADRQMYADYKTEINFAIVKGTLLWYNGLTSAPFCIRQK